MSRLRSAFVAGDGALAKALREELGARGGQSFQLTGDAAAADVLVMVPRRGSRRLGSGEVLGVEDRALIEQARGWLAGSRASAAGEAPARRLVLVSSALVHEPSHRHAGHLSEDRLARRPPANRVSRRWRALEAALSEGASSRGLVILRPTFVPVVGGRDAVSRLLSGRSSLAPAGYDPPLQLLELAELADVVTAALAGELEDGVWHVAPADVIPLEKAMARAGVRRVPLPSQLLRGLYRLRGAEPDEVEALRYPVTVSDAARRRVMATSHPDLLPGTLERSEGELAHDPFSLDRAYVARLGRTLFRFLHDRWWRIEWQGLEHVPGSGGAVLVGNHRGHQPWDGVMVLHRLASDLGRHPRFLIHPTLVKFPFLAPYMSGCGGLHACVENGDWVLAQQQLLAIFPEGIRGAFARYRDVYRLRRFRPDYVRFALRHQVPIVPFVVVGSAEIFPILAKIEWRWWKRVSEWPTLPITPTASLVPLPSKWHVRFLEPLDVAAEHGPEAADDPKVVDRINREVRQRMALALADILARRPGVFRGSVFSGGAF
ncbi:MAG: 1-acyl-sn-glycerol-3-phosphate acyltransferase [Acidobacteria bacterium]|nr:1-acyl-sn-glycerol-3-phosphate acyltransferase [Acidobacteriota bacterium]